MEDIAQLGLSVDSSDAVKGSGNLDKLTASAGKAERASKGLAGGYGQTSRAGGLLSRATGTLSASVGGLARQFGVLAVAAVSAFTLSGSIASARELNAELAEVSTLLPVVAGEIDLVADASRRLGIEYGTGSRAQVSAFYQGISAGAGDAEASTRLLESANRTAIGGITSTATAVDILTTATNAYAADALSATDAADVLFVGMRAGKTTIGELANTLGRVIPTATALGVGFDEIVAATSALTTQGQSTEMAVTGINAALSQLLSPSSQATELARELGVEFSVAGLQARGFAGFMDHVVDKTDGSQEAMAELFGSIEALRAVFSLAGQGGVQFNAIMAQMENRAGAAEEAYQRVANEIDQRLNVVTSEFAARAEDVGASLLQVMVPALEQVVLVMNGAEEASTTLEFAMKAVVVTVGVLMVASLGQAAVAAIVASNAYLLFGINLHRYGLAAAVSTLATNTLGVAVRFALGPIGLAITAIGLLTAAWVAHRSPVEIVRDRYSDLYDELEKVEGLQDRAQATSLRNARSLLAEASAAEAAATAESELALATQRAHVARLESLANSPNIGRAGALVVSQLEQAREQLAILDGDQFEDRLRLNGVTEDLRSQLEALLATERNADRARRQSNQSTRNSITLTDEYADALSGLNQTIEVMGSARGLDRDIVSALQQAGLDTGDRTSQSARAIIDAVTQINALNIQDSVQDLREQADAFGMTSRQIEIYRLELAGASAETIADADAILRNIEAMERQEEIKDQLSQIIEDSITPVQRYQQTIRDLNEALNNGLDHDIYARAVDNAQDAFVKADERMNTLRNSASGFIRDIRGGVKPLEAFANVLNRFADRAIEQALDGIFRSFTESTVETATGAATEATKGIAHGTASGTAIATAMTTAAVSGGAAMAAAITTAGATAAATMATAIASASAVSSSAKAASSLAKAIPGFSMGGSILPSGSGSTDSQIVTFRKRPDERVDILTPRQQRSQGGVGERVLVVRVDKSEYFDVAVEEVAAPLAAQSGMTALSIGQRGESRRQKKAGYKLRQNIA